MNDHAGWSQEGICIKCGSDSPSSVCSMDTVTQWQHLVHYWKRMTALEFQIEIGGCAAALFGETTYECSIRDPCGLCRLRNRAETAERRLKGLDKQNL